MQTTSFNMSELLRRIKDKSLTIPQFQRKFTWKESQVKMLVDSLSRSFPIGSLLLLTKKPEFPLSSRSIEAVIQDEAKVDECLGPSPENQSEVFYILDGQQRTTSIARVFLNAHPNKAYYFDLKRMLADYRDGHTSWILARNRGKNAPDRKDNNRLMRTDVILDQSKSDIYIAEYIEDSGDFPEFGNDRRKAREAASFIKGIFESIRNYQIPIVVLERDSGIDAICRIFETINSTGTKLTTFDLAVARFFPEPDLREKWTLSLEKNPILERFRVDGERALQVLHLIRAGRGERYAEPTRTNLLSLPTDVIENEWSKSAEALAYVYKWAESQGAQRETLPNHGVLVSLAAYFGLFKDAGADPIAKHETILRRWYFTRILQGGASRATNYRIGEDFSSLCHFHSGQKALELSDVKINPELIMTLKKSDKRYKAIQNILAMTIKTDLILGRAITSSSETHDHHIFPHAAQKKHGANITLIDGIANRLPVLVKTNLNLGEAYPKEYLSKIKHDAKNNGTMSELKTRLTDCLIPGNPEDKGWEDTFDLSRFDEFSENRALLILERVRAVVGDSLNTEAGVDPEILDDD